MQRAGRVSLAYAVAFAAFLVVPVAFRTQAPWPFPKGVYWQEVLDLLTPVVLIPLSWLLCSLDDAGTRPGRGVQLAFLVMAAVWVEGQGVHLAANSIARPWEHAPAPTGALAEWYDGILSHYLWHVGIVGIWAIAIARSLAHPIRDRLAPRTELVAAALVLGVTWFAVMIESGTEPLTLPFTVAAALVVAVQGRPRIASTPVASFLGGAFAVSLLLVAAWAIRWGGQLPQFTEVGLL